MFKQLKEFWNRELTYRRALSTAKAEERLKNVSKEAELDEKIRLEKKKRAINSYKTSTSSFKLSKPTSSKSSNASGSIMDLEF